MDNKNNKTTDPDSLFNLLKPIQEKKGYHFNADKTVTLELLESLLKTKEKYGYMTCPCRLANGNRADDADIICPCVYREADVKEFGSCYCNLYVSPEWNANKISHQAIPERRPPENIKW